MLANSKSTVSLIALFASFSSLPAYAQSTPESTESVVVTGSRVITNIANSPTPLTSISNDELSQLTPTSVSDALLKMPVFSGSSFPRQAVARPRILTILNLRNFGGNRTLTMMDGHRLTPSLQDGTVGVETLPMTLMTRTEVVTGGASAVYGSDAVSGVVNFVLDKEFTGLKADFNGGISTYADGASFKFEAAAGTSLFGGRGHIEVAVSSRHRDIVYDYARPFGYQPWVQTGAGSAANPYVDTPFARRPTAPFGGAVTLCGGWCVATGYNFYSPWHSHTIRPGKADRYQQRYAGR